MSSKLIRKALQQSIALDDATANENKTEKGRTIKEKKKMVKNNPVALSKQDLLQRQVDSMLRFDKYVSATKSKKSSKAVLHKRMVDAKHRKKTEKKLRIIDMDGGIINSRSSSSWYAKQNHAKTFNKVKDKKEKERKSMEDIAKLLRKKSKSKEKRGTS